MDTSVGSMEAQVWALRVYNQLTLQIESLRMADDTRPDNPGDAKPDIQTLSKMQTLELRLATTNAILNEEMEKRLAILRTENPDWLIIFEPRY